MKLFDAIFPAIRKVAGVDVGYDYPEEINSANEIALIVQYVATRNRGYEEYDDENVYFDTANYSSNEELAADVIKAAEEFDFGDLEIKFMEVRNVECL